MASLNSFRALLLGVTSDGHTNRPFQNKELGMYCWLIRIHTKKKPLHSDLKATVSFR